MRLTNPDLWHPYMGGEKPMDFAYFNGVLRSTVFPPIDPWHAGGYINYYYFGYVIVGSPVLLLGMMPLFVVLLNERQKPVLEQREYEQIKEIHPGQHCLV